MYINNVLYTGDEVKRLRISHPADRIVLAGGCFDVLHYGHVRFLEEARKQGDVLCIALEHDDFIREKKNRMPVHTQMQRAYILNAMRAVDFVILIPSGRADDVYLQLVSDLRPQVIAVTQGDKHIDKKTRQARQVGAKVQIVTQLIPSLSTSHLITHASFSGTRHTV